MDLFRKWFLFLVGVFEENAQLLQWLVFFVSSTRSVHFFVHLFNIRHLDNIRNSKTGSPHYATFLKFFGSTKGSPLRLFRYFATQWMSKNPKWSPFYIFRHCDTVQKSHFFGFFKNLPRVPLYFHILQPTGVSQSPNGPPVPPFTIDIAPTLAVPGLLELSEA